MDRLISCEFNMDNACVELKFLDGSMIAIDTIAVENEVADNMYQRSELDYLVHFCNSIRRNIQRITGKSTDRKYFALIYDRILPEVQCHQFLVHAYLLSCFFTFLIVSC